MRTCIHGGTVVTADGTGEADLWIEGERILGSCDAGDGRFGVADRRIDASGQLVTPGGVDVHTHLDMPLGDFSTADDFETGTIAAAWGGTTTVVDYIGHQSGDSLLDCFAAWKRKADGRAVIDYGFHQTLAEASRATLAEMAELVDEGVTSFKVFLAYPERLLLDDRSIFQVMQRAEQLGAMVCVHAEAGPALDVLVEKAIAAGQTDPIFHALTRPEVAEATGTERAIALAELAGVQVYIVHVSCGRALDRIVEAQERGLPVLAETCPQYLFLDQEALRGSAADPFDGARYVCTPPLRTKENQGALWRGITERQLTVIATDHCPFNFVGGKDRGRGNFAKIPNGLPGIETRMPLIWEAALTGRISPAHAVELTATAPARAFGLYPQKGSLEPGADGDVVLWDPRRPMQLDQATLHTALDYSPYEGHQVPASPTLVVARGEIVVEDGAWHGAPGRGRYLPRRPVR